MILLQITTWYVEALMLVASVSAVLAVVLIFAIATYRRRLTYISMVLLALASAPLLVLI